MNMDSAYESDTGSYYESVPVEPPYTIVKKAVEADYVDYQQITMVIYSVRIWTVSSKADR